jgi:hypothetical protein
MRSPHRRIDPLATRRERARLRYAVLLVLGSLAALAADNANLDVITLNGQDCGLAGTASSPAGKDLNRHKNRYRTPDADQIDPDVSLAALLAPGKDVNRFDQEKGATIRGLVVNVLAGGNGETCNCGAKDVGERDTHIELALAADAPPTQRVIVEVTPRLRLLMKDKDIDWTTPTLREKLKGNWVEVTGWLLFDSMHITEAENTNPGNPHNWRATCWEVHPVTSLTTLDAPPAEAADFRPSNLAALHRLHAAHLSRAPNGKDALKKFHESYLSKFDPKEREEAETEAKERRPQP